MDILSNSSGLHVTIGIVFVSICIYIFFTSTFNYWKDRGVAFVKPLPFFGNMKDQFLKTKSFCDLFSDMYKELRGHKFGGYFENRTPQLMILDPELAEKVLIKDFTHFYDRGFSPDIESDPLSANLFNLEGYFWRNLRNKLTPTFTTGKLKGMFEQVCNCSESVVKYIDEESKTNQGIQAAPLMSNFALDVIASCAFGLQLDKDDKSVQNFRKAVKEAFEPTGFVFLKQIFLMYSPKLARFIGIKSMSSSGEKSIMTIISETLKYRRINNVVRNDFLQLMLILQKQDTKVDFVSDQEQHYKEDEFIDQMKHAGKAEGDGILKDDNKVVITDALIAAQMFIFLAGGSETVSSTITFCLYCLSQNLQIQEKTQKEIDSVLKQSGNTWSYHVLKEMTYLEQVIQETMRMYPSSPVLFRICTEEYKIPGTNVIIEKGTKVTIPAYNIQNDPDHYDSPEVFNPDRFLDNNFKASGTFMPFGNGPRICIAMRFALLEVKLVLAKILSQYTIQLNENTILPFEFSRSKFLLAPENEFFFNFNKRANV